MDRKPLFLRCHPEQYSTLLWPPAMCNHSCIRQELVCYMACYTLHLCRLEKTSSYSCAFLG